MALPDINTKQFFKLLFWIRRITAIVILACFILPLSQCRQYTETIDANGATILTTTEKTDLIASAALEEPNLEAAGWLFLFTWPLLFQFIRTKWQSLNESGWINIVELLLLGLSCYYIGMIVAMGTVIRYGGYIFILSASLYGLATIAAMIKSRK